MVVVAVTASLSAAISGKDPNTAANTQPINRFMDGKLLAGLFVSNNKVRYAYI